jgi:nucleoside-diphosphate-sugar epimerase
VAKLLVTGVAGCIGSWIARQLLEGRHQVVGVDLSPERYRLRILGIESDLPLHGLDISDGEAMDVLMQRERPDSVIHLAGMLVPACRENPLRASEVNVGGFIHLLEMARRHGFFLSYASSAAVYGPDLGYPLKEDEGLAPQTLYGVFKRTDEELARLYARDDGVASAGLRPNVVYGPGRDGGMSADVNWALWHASKGEPFHIRFGGRLLLEHASEVAGMFVRTALQPRDGASVYNLPGVVASIQEIIRVIDAVTGTDGLVTCDSTDLGIAWNQDATAFQRAYGETPCMDLQTGFRETLAVWDGAAAGGLEPRP